MALEQNGATSLETAAPADPVGQVLFLAPPGGEPHRSGQVLADANYSVTLARPHVLPRAASELGDFDVIVVDLRPLTDGAMSLVERLRELSDLPLLAIVGSAAVGAGVTALRVGADDFVTVTVSSEELLARIDSLLRRVRRGAHAPLQLTSGPIEIDLARRRVSARDVPVSLTALEYRLLCYLLQHPHEALTRERLLADVWGYNVGATATVTVHVRRLREKIEQDPARPTLIRTVWGIGYTFEPLPSCTDAPRTPATQRRSEPPLAATSAAQVLTRL